MATVKITLNTSRALTSGEYPVCIRLAHLKQSAIYIRIDGLSSTLYNWNKEFSRFKKNRQNHKFLNQHLTDIENRIDGIAEKLVVTNSFSYQRFKDLYSGVDKIDNSVYNGFNEKIKDLFQLDKSGTAIFYKCCLTSLKEFTNNKPLTFEEIDYKFLKEYEKQRRQKGNSGNTIAIYFRGLRAIHYEHCKLYDLSMPSAYVKFNIQGLTTKTRKRALTKLQLSNLINYKPISWHEQKAVNVFLLSIYMNGANLMDIAQLRKENIVNNRIEYRRAKTGGLFSIKINDRIENILNTYEPSYYLLPIINNRNNVAESIRSYNRILNKILKRIAIKINIPEDLTIYWARHTFANLSRAGGNSIEIISQALGHADLNTTKIYLKSFENSELDKLSENILNSL